MPIIVGMLFVAAPLAAALALDTTVFVAVLILFCVVAGLNEGAFAAPDKSGAVQDEAPDARAMLDQLPSCATLAEQSPKLALQPRMVP